MLETMIDFRILDIGAPPQGETLVSSHPVRM